MSILKPNPDVVIGQEGGSRVCKIFVVARFEVVR